MSAKKKSGQWIKPKKNTTPQCGCVYSVIGFLLWACPNHEEEESKKAGKP